MRKLMALLGMVTCNVGLWVLVGYGLHQGWILEAVVFGCVAAHQSYQTYLRLRGYR